MLIQREWITVQKLSYPNTLDSYGQLRQATPTETDIEVVWKLNDQTNIQNPKYVDVEVICLTKDKTITDSNQIKNGNKIYNIMYLIPGKYTQIFLKRV